MRTLTRALTTLTLAISPFASSLSNAASQPQLQAPLRADGDSGIHACEGDLIQVLRKAEIIPTVLDAFEPLITLAIFWNNAAAEVGNTLPPSRLKQAPGVELIHHVPSVTRILPASTNKGPSLNASIPLTLALTDPDAPSRSNPEWSQVCHWIVTNVPLTEIGDHGAFSTKIKEVMPYKAPGPPPKTGKHRYVFVALAPKNRTTEELVLRKPEERHRWGGKVEREGVREWADEMGLEVVGANFIYAQNEEQ